MTDVTQGNSEAARTATGEIVDQTPKTPDTTSSQTNQDPPKSETKAEDPPPKTADQSKSDGDKSLLAEEKKGDDKPKAEGAPEKYEDFKLPEGIALEPKALEEATAVFKELGISQEGAQKLVDFHVKTLQEANEGPLKLWQDKQTEWKKEVAEDPKLGPRLPEIKANYSRMLDAMGDPAASTAFKEMVEYTGAGNNPAFIRMIDKIASHFAEGKPLAGGKPAPVKEPGKAAGTGAHALYPNNP
jgi:hypothetical protein